LHPSVDRHKAVHIDSPITILIIEDHESLRLTVEQILKREGFTTLSASDGGTGLALALEKRPHVVLCDVTLPVMDGHEILQALRADPRGRTMQFIFLTGRGDRSDLRCGMNLGADDYLAKPVSREELLEAIRVRLQRAEAYERSKTAEPGFHPDFSSAKPLESLGLSPRVAEVLLWIAQGKSNSEIASILGISEFTVKRHVSDLFAVLGVDNRNAAAMRALEILNRPPEA
jgi:DNA-binding NarL/FixJ family response regulator